MKGHITFAQFVEHVRLRTPKSVSEETLDRVLCNRPLILVGLQLRNQVALVEEGDEVYIEEVGAILEADAFAKSLAAAEKKVRAGVSEQEVALKALEIRVKVLESTVTKLLEIVLETVREAEGKSDGVRT